MNLQFFLLGSRFNDLTFKFGLDSIFSIEVVMSKIPTDLFPLDCQVYNILTIPQAVVIYLITSSKSYC